MTILAALVLASGFATGTAQTSQDNPARAEGEGERKFENAIPAHVPLKVKLKNEQSFKDKKNRKWAEELEIEVKNTGDKPIYYVYLTFRLDGFDLGDGIPFVFLVKYGRPELAFLETPLEPNDVPIKPGESVTIKVHKGQTRGFERFRDKLGKPDVMKVRLEMNYINFGDGTGLRFPSGKPDKARKQTSAAPPRRSGADTWAPPPRSRDGGRAAFLNALFSPATPASLFSRVNFFLPAPVAQLPGRCNNCQAVAGCMWGVRALTTHCPCDPDDPNQRFPAVYPVAGCDNNLGGCILTQTVTRTCATRTNGEQPCQFQEEVGLCSIGDPTPTPTPTPTPSPSPTPNLATRPNPKNCEWFGFWLCTCFAGAPADYPRYGQQTLGCRAGTFNDGHDCCQCTSGELACPEGYTWDTRRCDCCNTQGRCLGDTASCTAEECQGDVGEGPGGETTGLQTDEGQCPCASPVLIDVGGDGFRLTGVAGGVRFDLNGDGRAGRLAWTAANSDDAWLALDRDGDGVITSGRELFGNLTEQPTPPAGEWRHGFRALAVFDQTGNGGNADGAIDSRDAVFSSLRLWRDANHDGASQPGELHALASLDVVRLHLNYKESKRTDEFGNRFRFRAKLDDARGAKVNRWAWDVFLLAGP